MADDRTSTITQALPIITQALLGDNEHDVVTSTIGQTLPALGQIAYGESLGQQVGSTIYASSSEEIHIPAEVSSTAYVESETFCTFQNEVASSAKIFSTATYDVFTYAISHGYVSSTLELADTHLVTSNVIGSSKVSFGTTLLITSAAQANSSVQLGRDVAVESLAQIRNELYPGVQANQIETSRAIVSSYAFLGQFIELTSSATIASTVEHWTAATESIESTVAAASSIVNWAAAFEEVTSEALVTDQVIFASSIYSETVTSVVHAKDWMWAKDFGSIAWVMNTESSGLSNYDNFGFTSLAFHGGKLYGTSPEGLFEMGAGDDDGRDIDAVVGRGFEGFGGDHKKRISDIFVGHTGGTLECDVETYDKQVYTYPLAYRDSDAPRNSRIKPGRGLSSRWWRLTFRNVGGEDFQIQDIAVHVARSMRRL
jgi:hypothetical protein